MKRLILLFPFVLASCGGVDTEDLPPVTAYVGSANIIAGEVALGPHRIGLGASYRYVQELTPSMEPPADKEIPIIYPTNDK